MIHVDPSRLPPIVPPDAPALICEPDCPVCARSAADIEAKPCPWHICPMPRRQVLG